MLKGEIWLVDLNGGVGSEQGGVRPCLIVQNNIGNKHSPTTIVCPITKKGKEYTATHMRIEGLSFISYVLFEQIKVVDKSRFIHLICTLDKSYDNLIKEKLLLTLGA